MGNVCGISVMRAFRTCKQATSCAFLRAGSRIAVYMYSIHSPWRRSSFSSRRAFPVAVIPASKQRTDTCVDVHASERG